jgi:hypothetical protein
MKLEKIESFVLRIELTMDESRALEKMTGNLSTQVLMEKGLTSDEAQAFKQMWTPIVKAIGESP